MPKEQFLLVKKSGKCILHFCSFLSEKKKYNIFIICLIGAPKGFCDGKMDGKFAAPHSNTKFFHCVHYKSTVCQSCPGGLIFKARCETCMREGEGKYIK